MTPVPPQANNTDLPAFHALIVAAGKGTRSGQNTPKQFVRLNGKAVVSYSIDLFEQIPQCQSIGVIVAPEFVAQVQNEVKTSAKVSFIEGGEERINSVYNGLKSIPNIKNEDIILIHDAARPCLKARDVEKLLAEMTTNKAATLAAPVSSTLRKDNGETVPREGLWAMQTPQAFRYGDLLSAHENALKDKTYTDDTALLTDAGIDVKLVQGSESNIKITYEQDFEMAAQLLKARTTTLTGQGFDVHAFDKDTSGPARICGIDVPHDHKLKGHSDADVGLHALTDAILGAIGEGDIGIHFPPSDNTFKDMDSRIFLEKALEMLAEKHGQLNNIDLTLICERPKIGPHAPQIRQRLADITGLPLQRINVKATTTEGLGFTGRGEGIAAQALVTLTIQEQI